MPALPAAEVQDLAMRLDGRRRDDEVDLAARVLVVLDDVAVRLDVERVEELPPPFRGEMLLEVRDRTEAGARRLPLRLTRLWHRGHDGPLSSRDRFCPGPRACWRRNGDR